MRLLPAAAVAASLVSLTACTPIGLPPSSPPSSAPSVAAPVAEPSAPPVVPAPSVVPEPAAPPVVEPSVVPSVPAVPAPPVTAPAAPSGTDYATTGEGPGVQVFIDDMAGAAEGVPAGVPDGYDWKYASRMGRGIDSTDAPYVNAWGQLYPVEGTTPPPNCRVEIRDIGASAVGADGVWRVVQSSAGTGGGAFPASYQGANAEADVVTTADGASSVGRPPAGYNHHFWPTTDRGRLPSPLTGIVAHFKARLVPTAGLSDDCDQAQYVIAAGADYYGAANGTAGPLGDVAIGRSKLVEREWRWFTMATPSAADLLANPPFGP